jgi:hypothetical protein
VQAETEKRQKEDARQSDLLQLQQKQQQQQQLQLHLLQQQHLQQLLAQQQQILHRPQNASNYSFNNPIMNQSSNGQSQNQNQNQNHHSNNNSNGNKMNMSANNQPNPTNSNTLNTLNSLNTSSNSPRVMIDPQRDLRSRENLGLGSHSLSNTTLGTPMQVIPRYLYNIFPY